VKITKLKTWQVPPRWLFLKVETDECISGWGEPVLEGRAATVEAAVLRASSEGVDELQIRHLFPERPEPPEAGDQRTYQEQMQQYRREVITRALRDTDWNVSEAARRLDIARSHLNKLIKALGVVRDG